MRTLDARARGFGALVGVRPAARAVDGAWPFSRRLVYALQDPEARDATGNALISRVVDRFRVGRVDDGQVQSFAFVKGRVDYVLVPPLATPLPAATTPTPSPSSRKPVSVPPSSLPALEPLLHLADDASARGAWEDALAGYKAALMVVPEGDAESRASIYARVGAAKRAQGKLREAKLNFEKALAADPDLRAALDALVELAGEGGEPRRAIDWRRKRLEILEDDAERVLELQGIASAHAALRDTRAATGALEEAHALAPSDPAVTQALLEAYEAVAQWPRVLEFLVGVAGGTSVAADRAAVRFAAADVALGRLRDEDRGSRCSRRRSRTTRPREALQALVSVRTGGPSGPRSTPSTRASSTATRTSATSSARGTLAAGSARSAATSSATFPARSRRSWGGALQAGRRGRARDARRHAPGARRRSRGGRRVRAHRAARPRAREHLLSPVRAPPAWGAHDRAWLAGLALEELGVADMDPQLVVHQFRVDGASPPSRALDAAEWDRSSRAPGPTTSSRTSSARSSRAPSPRGSTSCATPGRW